jgi:hypothetical protein
MVPEPGSSGAQSDHFRVGGRVAVEQVAIMADADYFGTLDD